jgi:NAD-dependent deacetylase
MTPAGSEFPRPLLERIREAGHLACVTGAGVSAESGVPTFRDSQTGLWAKFKPEELATAEAFQRNPRLVWEWYAWRRGLVARAAPNPAHLALAEFERRLPRFTLVTQNVDGLHQRAGSRNVIELHGNITRAKCFDDGLPVSQWEEGAGVPPRCPRCGGLLRPDVVWFGEMLPVDAIEAATAAMQDCDVCFSVGTSAVVQPATSLPELAKARGAILVEINPAPTPLTLRCDYSLQGLAGEILPALVRAVGGEGPAARSP